MPKAIDRQIAETKKQLEKQQERLKMLYAKKAELVEKSVKRETSLSRREINKRVKNGESVEEILISLKGKND